MIDAKEGEQILQRVKIFKPCSIAHRNESYTLLKHFNCEIINKAPSYLSIYDFSVFFCPFVEEASHIIDQLDILRQINPECLKSTTWIHLNQHHLANDQNEISKMKT